MVAGGKSGSKVGGEGAAVVVALGDDNSPTVGEGDSEVGGPWLGDSATHAVRANRTTADMARRFMP